MPPANNQTVSYDTIAAEVANGTLTWKTTPPSLGKRQATRAWFAQYVTNKGGFSADSKLITWGEIMTYKGPPPPNVTVAGAGIGRDFVVTGPSVHTVYWSAQQNTQYPIVVVEWYVNWSFWWMDEVSRSAGQVSRTFNAEDDVYARLAYKNESGTGPWVTTTTV